MEQFKIRNGLRLFEKKADRKKICVAYLGGSITLAEGYRIKVTQWLREQWPEVEVSQINAGIGGTGSVLGAFRLENDVLRYNPDLIFVEFAVNDCEHTSIGQCQSAMEGIVRKIWNHDIDTDICFIYAINQQIKAAIEQGRDFWTIQEMEQIAEYYGIPSINMGIEVVCLEKAGRLVYQASSSASQETVPDGKIIFSRDGVHPTLDEGHAIYANGIIQFLESIKNQGAIPVRSELKPELFGTPWENARLVPLSNVAELSSEWSIAEPAQEGLKCENIHKLCPLYKTVKPGSEIRFNFKGTGFGLLGIFGLISGQFTIDVDGVTRPPAALFDKYGNIYRVHYAMAVSGLPDAQHYVIMKLDSIPPDRSMLLPERIVSDPSQMEGIVAYIYGLLLLGEPQ